MKAKTYYCHAITKNGEFPHILKVIYNPENQIAHIFKEAAENNIILASLNAEGDLGEVPLFDLCLNLIEEELGACDIVKASLSEEKSYLVL